MTQAPASAPATDGVSTILVYTGLDLIGDGLLKLPFLRALRQAWPAAHITWLAGIGETVFAGPLAELVQPYIDETIQQAGIGLAWGEALRRPLQGRRFDLVIDTQRRFRTALILSRIRHRAFISGATRFLLSSRRPGLGYRKDKHMVAAMLRLIELASGRAPRLDRELALPPRFQAAASASLPGGPYAGFVPGAGGVQKRWPLDRFLAAAAAAGEAGFRPVFFLGPAEAGWAADIAAACPEALLPLQDPAVAPALRASPLFTIACGQRVRAAVANDCGAGHMLAAADTRLLSLFGPTDPQKFAPFVTTGQVLRAQAFGGTEMAAIPTGAVTAALLALLRS